MTKTFTPTDIENMDERSRDEYFMTLPWKKPAKLMTLEKFYRRHLVQKIIQSFHATITAELDHDATAHAEVLVIREACDVLKRWRLTGCTLYVTIEPCPMCAGAIINSRIDRVVYGASDSKGGAVESLFNVLSHPGLNHEPELASGVLGDECSQIMKDFFKERRKARREYPRG